MIDNEITDRITKVSKVLPKNNSKTVTNRHDKEIPKDRYIYPEIKIGNYWWTENNIIV